MAVRLSLEYGAGQGPSWFGRLSREDQIAVLAFERAQNTAREEAAQKARARRR